ncbi:MAG TPA: tRNA lysidine(34) synthetase TilS [Anaeromyxobacter sp.]|nr:tRNA lysidine(34) synthetase TilS [Anaeromyxobacter sp.]
MRRNRLHPYPAAVLATLRRRKLLRPGDAVLVALSAGPDSTALVAALAALRDAGELGPVHALHVDHGLRPGGDADAACAAATCARLGVPFSRARVRVGPGNVQAAARRARYAALRAEARRVGAAFVATGHTRTDQAETVLLRLLRGAGARGLSGIPPRRGAIVRPLLDRSRVEGIRFLEDAALAWREDPTNATPRYARNRLRLALWPAVLALAPAAERALARAADLARADERALAARARAVAGGGTSVALASLAAEPSAVRRRVVRRLWRNASGSAAGLDAAHVAAVLALARRRRPGRAALPDGIEARARYGRLELGPAPARARALAAVEVTGPGTYVLGAALAVEVAARAPDAVPWPLALRSRRPGDRFRPEGGRGTKKLKSWLIDRKVPRERRDGLVVLAAGPRVLAVPELGAVADGLGPSGAGLTVRVYAGA